MSREPREEHSSTFDPLRRIFYRYERKLILLYLLVIVLLNVIPLAWVHLNQTYGIEQSFIDARNEHWTQAHKESLSLWKSGNSKGAITFLERHLAQHADMQLRERHGRLRIHLMIKLTEFYLAQGEAKKAEAVSRKITEVDPNDFRGYQQLGLALMEIGKANEGLEQLKHALQIYPYNLLVVKKVIKFYAELGEHTKVIDAFENYLDALYVGEGVLAYSEDGKTFEKGHVFKFPARIDGQSHTYRIYPETGRYGGKHFFSQGEGVKRLMLAPIDVLNVAMRIEQLRITAKRDVFDEVKEPLLDERSFDSWKARPSLLRREGDYFLTVGGNAGVQADVDLAEPQNVAEIAITVTLYKAVDSETATLVKHAYKNTYRLKEAKKLFGNIVIFDELGPSTKKARVHSKNKSFSFSVIGHVRRDRGQELPIQTSLLQALPEISKQDRALIFTGDLIWSGTEKRWQQVQELVVDALKPPVFIAPGNHDLHLGTANGGRALFVSHFGPTYFEKRIENSQLLVLDTELSQGDFQGAQLAFIEHALNTSLSDPSIQTVFLFMHRVFWLQQNEEFRQMLINSNKSTRKNRSPDNYIKKVLPLLEKLSKTKRVVVFGGDVGSKIPICYARSGNLEFVASGNHAVKPMWWNHYIRVHVDGADVELEIVPLEGYPMKNVSHYTADFWEKNTSRLAAPEKIS